MTTENEKLAQEMRDLVLERQLYQLWGWVCESDELMNARMEAILLCAKGLRVLHDDPDFFEQKIEEVRARSRPQRQLN